jgi:hypothetical protein
VAALSNFGKFILRRDVDSGYGLNHIHAHSYATATPRCLQSLMRGSVKEARRSEREGEEKMEDMMLKHE